MKNLFMLKPGIADDSNQKDELLKLLGMELWAILDGVEGKISIDEAQEYLHNANVMFEPLKFGPEKILHVLSLYEKHSELPRPYGAVVLLYPNIFNEIGTMLGESYYILPSSVHEVLVLRDSLASTFGDDPTIVLSEMVHDVNRKEVTPEDRLSDSIFFWNSKTKKLERVYTGGDVLKD